MDRKESVISNMQKYKIITLCGSTRFKNVFMEVQKKLTLEGNIVISVGCFGHAGDKLSDEQKLMLDDIHKKKIDIADEIFVINVGGYIGNSTKSEIKYAIEQGKKISFLVNEKIPVSEMLLVTTPLDKMLKIFDDAITHGFEIIIEDGKFYYLE